MAGKTWWQEGEAAGHIMSSVWKQREMNSGAHSLLFIQFGTLTHGVMPSTFSEFSRLESPLQTHPEACLMCDSRSHDVDSQDTLSRFIYLLHCLLFVFTHLKKMCYYTVSQ